MNFKPCFTVFNTAALYKFALMAVLIVGIVLSELPPCV